MFGGYLGGYMIVPRMPRWIILAILLLVVLGRSAVFVLAPEACFDADQAIVGLMAKHTSVGLTAVFMESSGGSRR